METGANTTTTGAAPKGAVSRLAITIVRVAGALSTALILLAFALTVLAVFMRYIVNTPLMWSDDASGWMLVTLIMLGAAEAYRRDIHIGIDLLTARLGRTARRVQETFADLAVLAFATLLGISAWEAVTFSRAFDAYTSGTVEVPLWLVQLPLPIGAVLLGLVAISRILSRHFKGTSL
ncbi:TRAP transporter small permease [Thalassovita sp.]|uniref:TRAP transporter small permease n=1 Tax=Thalassovita sp. TaxID=1979401 RepID=UPI0029DE7526|nr:TRAP transporter small permease [Thalassovita sp.]